MLPHVFPAKSQAASQSKSSIKIDEPQQVARGGSGEWESELSRDLQGEPSDAQCHGLSPTTLLSFCAHSQKPLTFSSRVFELLTLDSRASAKSPGTYSHA